MGGGKGLMYDEKNRENKNSILNIALYLSLKLNNIL